MKSTNNHFVIRATLVMLSATAAAASFAPTTTAAPAAPTVPKAQSEQKIAKTVDFYGQQVDPKVSQHLQKYANENNLDLAAELRERPVNGSPDQTTGEPGAIEAFGGTDSGGVEVPATYVYDPALGPLHDYCTNSPDQFPAPGVNADFSGPCAMHDMCYEAHPGDPAAMRACDSSFRDNLLTVCGAVYTPIFDPRNTPCNNTALVYYSAVVAAHHDNYL